MYSVIVPAKNESENIARCVRSIFACADDRSQVEVIVVDNGSTDETKQIAELEGAIVLADQEAHISGLRNLGAKNASFNVLGFIDADCEALPGWLKNAQCILADETIGIVGDYYRLPKQPSWIENAYFSSIAREPREVPYLSGGNMVMRKDTFLKVGGFDEKMITGEDYGLCLRVRARGFKVIGDPSVSVVHHGNPKTLMHLFRREVWCGLGMLDLYKTYKSVTLPLIWSLTNLILVLFIFLALLMGYFRFATILVLMGLSLPGGAALMRSRKGNSYRYLLPLYAIFTVYGFARTVSILKRLKWAICSLVDRFKESV